MQVTSSFTTKDFHGMFPLLLRLQERIKNTKKIFSQGLCQCPKCGSRNCHWPEPYIDMDALEWKTPISIAGCVGKL
jgi:hypothetical protein